MIVRHENQLYVAEKDKNRFLPTTYKYVVLCLFPASQMNLPASSNLASVAKY